MSLNDIMFIENLPKLDIHGLDRDTAKINIKQFVSENYELGNKQCVIVHGMGTGILKKVTAETLNSIDEVLEHKTWFFNAGCTVFEVKDK